VPLWRVQKCVGHADPWITENVHVHLVPDRRAGRRREASSAAAQG
jgi:hypothetical protein